MAIIEYKVKFVGVTPNQAQAIQTSVEYIKKELNGRDKVFLDQAQKDLIPLQNEERLYHKILDVLGSFNNSDKEKEVIGEINKRLAEMKPLMEKHQGIIDQALSNIEYIDDYVKKINSSIREERDEENKVVTFYYENVEYYKGFIDLASIIFQFRFDEDKDSVTQE